MNQPREGSLRRGRSLPAEGPAEDWGCGSREPGEVGDLLALLIQVQHRFDASGRGSEIVAPSEARPDLQRWTSTGVPPGRNRPTPDCSLGHQAPRRQLLPAATDGDLVVGPVGVPIPKEYQKPWLGPSRLCTRHPGLWLPRRVPCSRPRPGGSCSNRRRGRRDAPGLATGIVFDALDIDGPAGLAGPPPVRRSGGPAAPRSAGGHGGAVAGTAGLPRPGWATAHLAG
jgi:hypothetical protein